jgi:capsular polysaccharide biosynthesis protein
MERDLSLKKLVKMYIANLWVVCIAGILVALAVTSVTKSTDDNTYTRSVYLVYDMENAEYGNLEAKKNTYFDGYKGLLSGNALLNSDAFNDEEKARLGNMSVSVESSCYTVTLSVPNDEKASLDKELFTRYFEVSEKWMQENFKDDSIQVVQVSDSFSNMTSGNNSVLLLGVGFVIGAILAALVLFVWFVLDKKIRTDEDVEYYMDLNCIGEIRRKNADVKSIREAILLSSEKVWGITSLKKNCGKTFLARQLAESLQAIGKKTLLISFDDSKEGYALENLDKAMEHLGAECTENKMYIADADKVEEIVLHDKFKTLLEVCKANYDYVIIDMKAVEGTGFTKVLCKMCGENMVVISKNVEDGVEAGRTIAQLAECGVSVNGVILNEYSAKKCILRM